jgi:hypothetical protein
MVEAEGMRIRDIFIKQMLNIIKFKKPFSATLTCR